MSGERYRLTRASSLAHLTPKGLHLASSIICRPCLRTKVLHFNPLLWNHLAHWDHIWEECLLHVDGPLKSLCFYFCRSEIHKIHKINKCPKRCFLFLCVARLFFNQSLWSFFLMLLIKFFFIEYAKLIFNDSCHFQDTKGLKWGPNS